jgi:uncharacterized protein with ParB-like and HNH nuclease domain
MEPKMERMTISNALELIGQNKILLPAIQRKFVWKCSQIEKLFDSLMQGYPINTFMFWKVSSLETKKHMHFSQILKSYIQFHQEDCPDAGEFLPRTFYAVVDGQQRLTSLYIGLAGTYAYRVKGKNKDLLKNFPERKLCLDLSGPVDSTEDTGVKYLFKFLSESDVQNANMNYVAGKPWWFEIGKMLKYNDEDKRALIQGCPNKRFAKDTLNRLDKVFFKEKNITAFIEKEQEFNRILEVFIRTNSGGTKLSKADLILSMVTATWGKEVGKWADEIVKEGRKMSIGVDREWVLKAALYLAGAPVRFNLQSFEDEKFQKIETELEEIKRCISSSFELLWSFGFTDESLPTKNAILPIAYYLFTKTYKGEPLYEKIVDFHELPEHRVSIIRWLTVVILKHSFGSHSDSVLEDMRNIIRPKKDLEKKHFDVNGKPSLMPLKAMVAKFKSTPKDLRFDNDSILALLNLHKDDKRCRAVLFLLSRDLPLKCEYDIDHLHPKKWFDLKELRKQDFLKTDKKLLEYYNDKEHWDTLPNLHLLDRSSNRGRQEIPLKDWVKDAKNRRRDLLLPKNFDLSFEKFPKFFETRSEALYNELVKIVKSAGCWTRNSVVHDDDDDNDDVE